MNELFQEIFEKLKQQLDLDDDLRETILKASRNSVRFSQEAVRAIHRDEFEKAKDKLKEAKNLIHDMDSQIKDTCPQLYYKGHVAVMFQEFVEAALFLNLIEGLPDIPGPEELQVSNYDYLQGLGDLIGEIRRYSLNAIRKEDFPKAEKCLTYMEEIYDMLLTLDYPEGLIPGVRRKVDVARSLIEKTRSELAYFQHGNRVVTNINRLLEKLKNTNTNEG